MKREIVLRRNIYSGKHHRLVYTGTGQAWEFIPAEPWMPTYYSYDEDGTIISLDSDGFGYPAYVGDAVDEYTIEAIVEQDSKIFVLLKPL